MNFVSRKALAAGRMTRESTRLVESRNKVEAMTSRPLALIVGLMLLAMSWSVRAQEKSVEVETAARAVFATDE